MGVVKEEVFVIADNQEQAKAKAWEMERVIDVGEVHRMSKMGWRVSVTKDRKTS